MSASEIKTFSCQTVLSPSQSYVSNNLCFPDKIMISSDVWAYHAYHTLWTLQWEHESLTTGLPRKSWFGGSDEVRLRSYYVGWDSEIEIFFKECYSWQ